MITQHYKIDLIPSGDPLVVHVSQYDTTARTLTFDLYNGGVAFEMPEGATASINGTKPDRTSFMYSMTADGTAVSIDLQQQMALVAGDTVCEIQITGSGGGKLGTANFILRVERAAIDENTVISETDVPIFEELVSDAQEAAADAAAAATTANTAAAAAETAAEEVSAIIPSNPGTTGQYLQKTASGAQWATVEIPSDVGTKDLRIKVTYTTGSGYTADHTYAEAIQNIEDGATPYIEYSNNGGSPTYYQLRSVTDTFIIFGMPGNGSISAFYLYAAGGVTAQVIRYDSSTTVTVQASAWVNGQATLAWASITGNSTVLLGYPTTTTATAYQAIRDADIRVVGQASGSITIEALGTVPTVDLVFQLSRL